MRDLFGRLCTLTDPKCQPVQIDREQLLVAFVQHRIERAEYLVRVPFLWFWCRQNADMVEWPVLASHLDQANLGAEVRDVLVKAVYNAAHFSRAANRRLEIDD